MDVNSFLNVCFFIEHFLYSRNVSVAHSAALGRGRGNKKTKRLKKKPLYLVFCLFRVILHNLWFFSFSETCRLLTFVKTQQQNVSVTPGVAREKGKARGADRGIKEVTQSASRALFFSAVKGDLREVGMEKVQKASY